MAQVKFKNHARRLAIKNPAYSPRINSVGISKIGNVVRSKAK